MPKIACKVLRTAFTSPIGKAEQASGVSNKHQDISNIYSSSRLTRIPVHLMKSCNEQHCCMCLVSLMCSHPDDLKVHKQINVALTVQENKANYTD